MQINVAQLLKANAGEIRQHHVDSSLSIDSILFPVQGDITITNTGQKLLVQAKLAVTADLTCGRCLQPFRKIFPIMFTEEFFPLIDVETGYKLETPDESGVFTINESHTLDLSEAIRQYIVMALPMKPLCCDDCAGICPNCGQDMNKGPCDCPQTDIDPRWAKLLKIEKKDPRHNN